MNYNFKTYQKKIDFYLRKFQTKSWVYECSSMAYKTCKEAKEKFCALHGLDHSQVKTSFSK